MRLTDRLLERPFHSRFVPSWHETVMAVLSSQARYAGVNGLSSVAVESRV
jgi:hypothetical protein